MSIRIPVAADAVSIAAAAGILQSGGLVAFPTETVYGLGADARNSAAVQKIFAAKGRPADHPLIVHLASVDALSAWAVNIPPVAYQLAAAFWPGPLAMILAKHPDVPLTVTGGQETIALRVPNHPVALQLLTAFGGGIAAPSANRFCRISPTLAEHVQEELGASVDMILDGGACQVGLESSIVDLSSAQPRLLRPGHISRLQLESVLQTTVELPSAKTDSTSTDSANKIRAPGMLEIHYAPLTPAWRCISADLGKILTQFQTQGQVVGLLSYRSNINGNGVQQHINLPDNPVAYAHAFYAALRQLDHLALDVIVVEQPPQTEDWRAVNDRLHKATRALT